MKSEKGITLLTLVITIIVIAIIAGIVTYSSKESIDSAKKVAFISEMEMIQAKVNSIYEERKADQAKVEYYNTIGRDISSANAEKVSTALGGTLTEGFRYFKSSDLEKLDLANINQEVLINYDTREVVSLTGVKIDGVMYYKLKDIPNYIGHNVEYIKSAPEAPTFKVEQTKLGASEYRFTIKDMVYGGNVKGGTVSYKLHDATNWILNGESTSFVVREPGAYDIKFTDSAGNSTIVQDFANYDYITNGLIAYYDAENNIGNGHSNNTAIWKDLSGNNHDATLTNINNTEASGWKADAVQLDGADDEIKFPVTRPEGGTFSVEIIFTEQNYEKVAILIGDKGWKNFHSHTYNGKGDIYIGGNFYDSREIGAVDRFIPSEIDYKTNIGKTDSIVYTYDGSIKQATFYANGKKLAQKTFILDPKEIAYFYILGSQKKYSRISFYDKVLTQDEVTKNYDIDKYRFNIIE